MLKTEKVNLGFTIKSSSFEKGKVYINNHEITDYDSFMKVANENNVLQQRINTANIKLEILQKDLMKLLKTGIPIKDITDIQDILRGSIDD